MLRTNKLNFYYGKKQVLDNVNFSANEREIIALIGPNGSGKSTLLRCLSGILRAGNNAVTLFGRSIHTMKTQQVAKHIAFLPQVHERVDNTRVYELVSMGRLAYSTLGWVQSREDKEIIAWALSYMHLTDLQDRTIEELSGGERQRVWIAMILAQDTQIVLLDEPVTYMDMKYQYQLLYMLRDLKEKFNKTIVAVFHDINHSLEVADRIYLLKNGKIFVCGTSNDVVTADNIKKVYDVTAHVGNFDVLDKHVVVPIDAAQ